MNELLIQLQRPILGPRASKRELLGGHVGYIFAFVAHAKNEYSWAIISNSEVWEVPGSHRFCDVSPGSSLKGFFLGLGVL